MKNCLRCGNEFKAERNTAKYCGNTCKTMANRERRKNDQITFLQNQEQAKIDEILQLKKERLRQRREQIAADQAEKQRIAEVDRKKLEDLNFIAAEDLRLKNEKDATDQAILDQQLEDARQQNEKDARRTAEIKSAWDAGVLKRNLEKKAKESEEALKLQDKKVLLIAELLKKALNSLNSPKKDEDK